MSKAPEQDPWPPLQVVGVIGETFGQFEPELYEHLGRSYLGHSSDRALGRGFLSYVQSLDSVPEVVA